jgi:hypothetical protein
MSGKDLTIADVSSAIMCVMETTRFILAATVLIYLFAETGKAKVSPVPLGIEMLPGKFESQKWYPEVDAETIIKKVQSGNIFRFEVKKNGKQTWHPILIAGKLHVEKDKLYIFSIRVKSDQPRTISFGLRRDAAPWDNLGFAVKVPLTTEWQTFTFSFRPKESSNVARFDIGHFVPGMFEFAEATLKPAQ